MVVSPKLRQFANDIRTKRGELSAVPGKGKKTIAEQVIPEEDTLLLQDFGVRRIFDKDGYPTLVAFGQWGNSYNAGNDTLYAKYQEVALKQAKNQAQNALAFYLNGQTHWVDKAKVGNQISNYTLTHHDNFKEEKFETTLTDIINETQESRAKVNVSGIYTVHEWIADHPVSGHEVVGVILAWSPTSEKSARALKEWKPATNNTTEANTKTDHNKVKEVSVKSSRTMMDVEDF
jgi:hypothetical protein